MGLSMCGITGLKKTTLNANNTTLPIGAMAEVALNDVAANYDMLVARVLVRKSTVEDGVEYFMFHPTNYRTLTNHMQTVQHIEYASGGLKYVTISSKITSDKGLSFNTITNSEGFKDGCIIVVGVEGWKF